MQLHRALPNPASNTPERSNLAMGFLTRHYVELLTVLALLFILQTGLVPFDLNHVPQTDQSTTLFGSSVNHLTLPDIISNIFLYVPLGVLVYLSLSGHTRHRLLLWPITVTVAFLLSFVIEWLQSYSLIRVSSSIDLVSNVVGACLGATLAWIGRWLMPRLINTTAMEWVKRPQASALKLYVALLVIVAAVPFSLSFDVTRLKQSVKNVVVVPFGEAVGIDSNVAARSEVEDIAADQHRWSEMKRWSRWSAEAVSFAVLAWLLHALVRGDYRFSRWSTTGLVWWFGAALALGLSLLQLPIVSRTCDVTDILFRCIGLGIGLLTRSLHLRHREQLSPELLSKRERNVALLGANAVAVYIIYTGLIPLNFELAADAPILAISSENFLPFFAYFLARFDLMMDDVLEKFLAYALFAALLAAGSFRLRTVGRRSRLMKIAVMGVSLSIAIEIVQIFIPVRTTSLTDPILACAACIVGVIGQHYACLILPHATQRQTPKPASEDAPISRWSPVDELMASLADPHPDAPREEVPETPARIAQHQP